MREVELLTEWSKLLRLRFTKRQGNAQLLVDLITLTTFMHKTTEFAA